ncbi:hypothetical protein Q75_05590 [Bacillus coahuilensis p1.1.43]|uniref:Uncharacterized protein n=1 Tax=Bacillus coahuilensis p1.1.43 TaxID=1150625 RepID=A0A147K9W9_9BACI|nr:RsfA family transcriptional regulator [Bacillus coahuilensis]KUP07328.1 hypothetical protein Q75_05590 [Bacillus coahuilensis p1.1.43]
MSSTRQDSWTKDEDLLLAEVVLRHIREGGTQLQAFEEVGRRLSRTGAACGFRWNSYVRKQYRSGIELAKKQRKENKQQNQVATKIVSHNEETSYPSISDITSYLKHLEGVREREYSLLNQVKFLSETNETLKFNYEKLLSEKKQLEQSLKELRSEHYALLSVLDKARKFAHDQDIEEDRSHSTLLNSKK